MRDKSKSVTLAELSGVGSVDVDENGVFTIAFLNFSIRMCEKRLYVLAAMLKEATLAIARAKAKAAKSEEPSSIDSESVVIELPLAQGKKILN